MGSCLTKLFPSVELSEEPATRKVDLALTQRPKTATARLPIVRNNEGSTIIPASSKGAAQGKPQSEANPKAWGTLRKVSRSVEENMAGEVESEAAGLSPSPGEAAAAGAAEVCLYQSYLCLRLVRDSGQLTYCVGSSCCAKPAEWSVAC